MDPYEELEKLFKEQNEASCSICKSNCCGNCAKYSGHFRIIGGTCKKLCLTSNIRNDLQGYEITRDAISKDKHIKQLKKNYGWDTEK